MSTIITTAEYLLFSGNQGTLCGNQGTLCGNQGTLCGNQGTHLFCNSLIFNKLQTNKKSLDYYRYL